MVFVIKFYEFGRTVTIIVSEVMHQQTFLAQWLLDFSNIMKLSSILSFWLLPGVIMVPDRF